MSSKSQAWNKIAFSVSMHHRRKLISLRLMLKLNLNLTYLDKGGWGFTIDNQDHVPNVTW